MSARLFFDIETVPAADEHRDVLTELYQAKKAKAAASGREFTQTLEEYIDDTGLSGEFGRIVCLAYAVDDGPVEALWGDEAEIVSSFWGIAKPINQFIGHNIYEFDFPFIYKRSRILGVPPSQKLSFARYRDLPIYDTMREWDLWSSRHLCSLDKLAKALGLPTSKDAMDGSQVGEYFKAGRIEEICEYCKKDVILTRDVFKRMTFQATQS